MRRFLGINPHKIKALEEKLERLQVKNGEVEEKFIRGGGPGGQNVNKTATCVYLKHKPTGTEVKVAKERSQVHNRFLAWRLLADKIEQKHLGTESAKQKAIEKIRRQKRKRSQRAKEKMLQNKKALSQKKLLRKITRQDQE